MAEIQANSTGLSGEYFVAAELLRRGYTVGITMGNTKDIDILAEKNGSQFVIQVKSIFKRKNAGWPISQSRIKAGIYYVFVILNGDKMTFPEYYICTGKEVYGKVKQYETRGVVDISALEREGYKGRWDIIC